MRTAWRSLIFVALGFAVAACDGNQVAPGPGPDYAFDVVNPHPRVLNGLTSLGRVLSSVRAELRPGA